MKAPAVPFAKKAIAVVAALTLACSMVPLAWADDGSAATGAGIAAGNTEAAEAAPAPEDAIEPDDAPEASAQSADAKVASGSAGPGTTVSIQVYRSSYPLVWDLNDEGSADVTKASWASKPAAWPTEGSPGSAVGTCDGYVPWTDDSNPGSEPSRLGFNFMGWSTKPDIAVEGTGKLDTLALPKDAPIVEGSDGVKRITLYALWAPVEYSVVFDLTKNPEDASAVPSFNWVDGEGNPLKGADGFSDLGGGRYRLSGVTLEDYDPATGLIEIATPARGTGGYRFLSWAEPDSQQDPAVAVMKAGSSKWHVNPVALPHYSYEPVLTARWALSFDVDVPSQVTFDQYDSLEVEGSLTDTTEKDAIDEESADAHDAGKQAHFCSQSTASDYKIVALKSVRQPTADDVLTTSDSSKATHDEVLGGERLLSLFAQGATSESQGVHFRLDDAIDMDDSSRYGSFTIPKQTKAYADSDHARDDENRLYVSYRLNLDNKVDGAAEPNHGLVVPENVQEGDRTPIAEVSYEFAVADPSALRKQIIPSEDIGKGDSPLYIDVTDAFLMDKGLWGTVQAGRFDLDDIKVAADDLSSKGTASPYYPLYKALLDGQVMKDGIAGTGPYFQLKVNDTYMPLQLIGICQDTKTAGGKAGLTFQMRDFLASNNSLNPALGGASFNTYMNATVTSSGGWAASSIRGTLRSTFWNMLDTNLQSSIAPVTKFQQLSNGTTSAYLQKTTDETVWLPSAFEVYGVSVSGYNESEALRTVSGYTPFQYQAYLGNNWTQTNPHAVKGLKADGSSNSWWSMRSCYSYMDTEGRWCSVYGAGLCGSHKATETSLGVVPCFCL